MFKSKNRTRYQLTMKAYSYVLVLAMIATIIVTPLGGLGLWATADEDVICDHVHDESCYAVPDDHVCSEELGCIAVYPMKTVVLSEGHEHTDECYGYIEDEESGEFVLNYSAPICGLQESEAVTEQTTDYDAAPDYWICNAEKVLVCDHANCTQGQPCLNALAVEEENLAEAPEEEVEEESFESVEVSVGSISGSLWLDNNDNGIWDDGENVATKSRDEFNEIKSGIKVGERKCLSQRIEQNTS